MSESRREVIRRPSSKEELAKLHPIERFLLRVFEFMSSIKLAVILMLWLSVECTIGTVIESQINTPAAQYFVYQTARFYFLLALLGMNILCAALIRFPWRLYQTGFVVTHCGLLIMLAGSLLTAKWNIDAQMSIRLDQTESTYLNPDRELLKIGIHTSDGKFRDLPAIPVEFGPLTWGSDILGGLTKWRPNHVEEFDLNSVKVRVKNFFANCSPENVYVEAEKGVPAIQYRLFHPERVDVTQWLAADPNQGMIGIDQSLGAGRLVLWRVSQEELEHFIHAVPREFGGLRGTLGFTYQGKHHLFEVDKLLQGAQQVPGTEIKVSVKNYYANAKLDRETNSWTSDGDVPENPLLEVKVVDGGQEYEYLTFGAHPEWSQLLAAKQGSTHLLTYFPSDIAAVVHLAMTPSGKLGYRAFGSQGLIAAELVETGKEYPCWAGLTFVPKEVIPSGRPELRLKPKLLKKGEMGNHGIIVEIDDGDKKVEAAVMRGMPVRERLGDALYTIDYTIHEDRLPFKVKLRNFKEPTNPGTRQAAAYESEVTVIDDDRGVEQEARIYMNHPLYYEGSDGIQYTLYQSGIDRSTGVPISTLTVANDPGLEVKYVGAIVLCVGIVLMFYMGGYFKKSSKMKARQAEKTSQLAATV